MYGSKCTICPGKILNSQHLVEEHGFTKSIHVEIDNLQVNSRSGRSDVNKVIKFIQKIKNVK